MRAIAGALWTCRTGSSAILRSRRGADAGGPREARLCDLCSTTFAELERLRTETAIGTKREERLPSLLSQSSIAAIITFDAIPHHRSSSMPEEISGFSAGQALAEHRRVSDRRVP